MTNVLEINDIYKNYGKVQALKGVTLNVPKGSVFGVLGPNGSGKTTLLAILLDVLQYNSGTYQWLDFQNATEARKHIGALLETPNFYHYMSAIDNLQISAKIKGRGEDDIDRVLKIVNLYERRNSPFKTFSLGMKQRLAIASAILGKPDILVLDEPTNGLDPVGISEIRELILQLSKDGMTIIMASHLLDEVEKVCDHVAILKKGSLITTGHVSEVLSDQDIIEISSENTEIISFLKTLPYCKILREDKIIQLIMSENYSIEQLNKDCMHNHIVLNHIVRKKKSLESKFMEITQ
jgi:ABC-type multidrug transport system ATPase subunit